MAMVTGELGLAAIERAGGPDEAIYAFNEKGDYPPALGQRIGETYRQLERANGPMTGVELLDDLESRNWLLPSGRPYRPSEHRQHLKYMVENCRLHVLTGEDVARYGNRGSGNRAF